MSQVPTGPRTASSSMRLAEYHVPEGIENQRLEELRRALRSIRRDPSSRVREAALLTHGLGDPGDGRVLEVGPGIGVYLFELRARGYQVDAVDAVRENADLLEQLSEHWAPDLEVVHGDVAELPYPDESFNGIYSVHVWEHVHDQVAALRECARVLRPGGRLVIIDGNFLNPVHWKELFIDRARNRKDVLAGFKWLANKRKVVDDFGMGWKGRDEDLKSVWWWRRTLARIPTLNPLSVTTTMECRRRMRGTWSLGPLAPFAGRIVVVAAKRA